MKLCKVFRALNETGKSYLKKVEQVYVLELVFKDEIVNPKYFSK